MLTAEQAAEVAKYERCYLDPTYAMGAERQRQAEAMMAGAPAGATFLDVGCGRGESLKIAQRLGYADWWGIEAVDALLGERVVRGLAWRNPFPDDSFHTVACFDVLEHLLPGDDYITVRECCRVAQARVLLTIGLYPSNWGGGPELHVNLRTPEEWDRLLASVDPAGWRVERAKGVEGINGAWVMERV